MNDNYGVDVLGSEVQLAVRASGNITDGLWHLPRPMEWQPSGLWDWQQVDLTDMGDESPIATIYRQLVAAIENDGQPPSSGSEGALLLRWFWASTSPTARGGGGSSCPLDQRQHPLGVVERRGLRKIPLGLGLREGTQARAFSDTWLLLEPALSNTIVCTSARG